MRYSVELNQFEDPMVLSQLLALRHHLQPVGGLTNSVEFFRIVDLKFQLADSQFQVGAVTFWRTSEEASVLLNPAAFLWLRQLRLWRGLPVNARLLARAWERRCRGLYRQDCGGLRHRFRERWRHQNALTGRFSLNAFSSSGFGIIIGLGKASKLFKSNIIKGSFPIFRVC